MILKRSLISNDIDKFYSETSEEKRLTLGLGPLELERNKALITRYLPQRKSVIVDVGGGPGIYAHWLAGLEHNVYLVDPVEKHIVQAKKRAGKLKQFTCIQGEAQHLALPSDMADVVVLHGPLYHLQMRESRVNAILEAKRVLKNGGIVLGFAINNTASSITGLMNGFMHDAGFFKMCKEELLSGLHNPAKQWPGLLPEGYFHQPEALQKEFEAAGLTCMDIIAVEGFIWLDKNYFESRADLKKKERLMELLYLTEKKKSLLALSPHIMIAAKK